MEDILILKRNDLEAVVSGIIEKLTAQTEPEKKTRLNFDECLVYLSENGFKISKSYLYKKTMSKEIPFQRFGSRKIVFDTKQLDEWMSEQLNEKPDTVTKAVAQVARKKN